MTNRRQKENAEDQEQREETANSQQGSHELSGRFATKGLLHPHVMAAIKFLEGPDRILDLAQARLPEWISCRLSNRIPERVHETFITQDTRHLHTDYLYRLWLKDGTELLFYLLVAHELGGDKLLPVHLAVYMAFVYQRMATMVDGEVVVPWTIPLVLSSGAEDKSVPLGFREMIDAPEGMATLPGESYFLLNKLR